MEWLTMWFYLVMKLDEIKVSLDSGGWVTSVTVSFVILSIVIALLVIMAAMTRRIDEMPVNEQRTGDEDFFGGIADSGIKHKKTIKRIWVTLLFLLLTISTISLIVPSTKQAMALVTVDLAIKNKDTAIKTGADLFNIVDDKVEKYLKIMMGDTTKKVVGDVKNTIKNGIDAAVEGAEKLKSIVETE